MLRGPTKRQKELARQEKQREKAAKREERRKEKSERPDRGGVEDPDIAGIVPGPQPLPEQFEDSEAPPPETTPAAEEK
jgi:hypothetical protein